MEKIKLLKDKLFIDLIIKYSDGYI